MLRCHRDADANFHIRGRTTVHRLRRTVREEPRGGFVIARLCRGVEHIEVAEHEARACRAHLPEELKLMACLVRLLFLFLILTGAVPHPRRIVVR